jgi:alpha-tubulin suppressor-like RCC1 family protein
MTLSIPFRYLLLTLLLIPTLLSGCGSSSEDDNIPYTVEVFNQHSIVFGNNSTVKMAGYNAYGQLGDNTRENRFEAVSVPGLGRITGFSAGATHTLAFTNNSSVMAWGFNSQGQLGNSEILTSLKSRTDDYSAVPVRVGSLTGVTSVAAGGFHSLAVAGGRVYSWGDNTYKQLGYTTDNVVNNAPVAVPDLSNVIQVAAGGKHSVALTSDGRVWAWGDNKVRQLGSNASSTVTSSATPIEVVFPAGYVPVEIAAGGSFSVARMSDGTVWAWGHNQYGQAGSETAGSKEAAKETPVRVALPTNLQATGIAAGLGHALALMSDGTVWAWGFNERGQLGNNPYVDYSEDAISPNTHIPVQMLIGGTEQPGTGTPITGVEKVQAFGNSSLVTRRNAEGMIEIWGWGDSGYGQLGVTRVENGVGFRLVPVLMRGI